MVTRHRSSRQSHAQRYEAKYVAVCFYSSEHIFNLLFMICGFLEISGLDEEPAGFCRPTIFRRRRRLRVSTVVVKLVCAALYEFSSQNASWRVLTSSY